MIDKGLLLEVGFGSVAERALSCHMFDQKTTLLASSLMQSAPMCPLCRMLMYPPDCVCLCPHVQKFVLTAF